METQVHEDSSIVLRPRGDLDFVGATALRHAVVQSVHLGSDLLIDLGNVESIDAVGVSALVGTVRRVRALRGTTTICNVSPEVRRRMDRAGVGHILELSTSKTGNDAA